MSDHNRINYSPEQTSSDRVLYAEMINGELEMREMPRWQAEQLQGVAGEQVETGYDVYAEPGTAVSTDVSPREMAPRPFVAKRDRDAGLEKAPRGDLKQRLAKAALITTFIVVPIGADYAVTTMVRGEVPTADIILKDPGQLPGQMVEFGQGVGDFVDQVKTLTGIFGSAKGEK